MTKPSLNPSQEPSQEPSKKSSTFWSWTGLNQLHKHSVKALLIKRLTLTALSLAIISSFAYSYLSNSVISEFHQKEGLQATENLADLTELALLYESGENAREAVLATLNFPSIKHIAIIDKSNHILFSEGDTNAPIMASLQAYHWNDRKAKIFERDADTWQIAAPVFTSTEYSLDPDVLVETDEESSTYLGYVAIQVDGSQVRAAQRSNLTQNLLVGMAYGLAFLIVVFIALDRLLKPMSALAAVLEKSKDGRYLKAHIADGASEEVTTISNAYNRMISALEERDQRLRSQKELLETEVALRTSELIQARDAALEANNLKSEFLANVTHELRTPLQSILGYSELLTENLEDEGLDYCTVDIEKISSNASHLLELINSILDIAKIEAGKMDIITELTDVSALVEGAAETVKPLMEKNNNRLSVDINLSQQKYYIDSKKVYQILLNLLSNAAKFTNAGSIFVSACESNGLLQLRVKDTGIGMSREQQRLIFEPFRQIDGTESRKFDGTGLGLSIVLRLSEILGGQVKLESELGSGSEFIIELPWTNESQLYESAS